MGLPRVNEFGDREWPRCSGEALLLLFSLLLYCARSRSFSDGLGVVVSDPDIVRFSFPSLS